MYKSFTSHLWIMREFTVFLGYLCGFDCSWLYITHSDAARALVTHTCSSCGKTVCSVCAPAGDVIPGDGFNKNQTLKDYRICLPLKGL